MKEEAIGMAGNSNFKLQFGHRTADCFGSPSIKQFEVLASAFFYGVLSCAGYRCCTAQNYLEQLYLCYAPSQAHPQLIYGMGGCI